MKWNLFIRFFLEVMKQKLPENVINEYFYGKFKPTRKQKARGPYRSPEKP
jgi:hypothetical protein